MATRMIPPRILKKIRYNTTTKPLNSPHPPSLSPAPAAAVVPPSLVEKPPSSVAPPSSTLNLEDAEKLFSSVPTSKLLRSSVVLHDTAVGPMVDLGMWVMKSNLVQREGVAKDVVMATIRKTFYEYLCAGEDAAGCGRSIRLLYETGLRGMLAYEVEDAHDNDGCDRNLNAFLHTVDVCKSLPQSSDADPQTPPNEAGFALYKATHTFTKEPDKWISDKSMGYAEAYTRLREERVSQAIDGDGNSPPQLDYDLFVEAVGGPDKNGRIYGLGSAAGSYKKSHLCSSTASSSSQHEKRMMCMEVTQLREELAQSENRHAKSESTIESLRTEMRFMTNMMKRIPHHILYPEELLESQYQADTEDILAPYPGPLP